MIRRASSLSGQQVPVSPGTSPTLPESRILTVSEVAAMLRCSRAHVHNLITGKAKSAIPLATVKIGRRRLIRRASLEHWIEASEGCYDPITPEFIAKAHGKD